MSGTFDEKQCAWWAHQQGLDGSLDRQSPAAVLERAGWARSVASASPYLAMFARAGTSREAADASVKGLELHELPAARGCTYVVPARDYALALRLSQGTDEQDLRTARKLGVTDTELKRLNASVLKALASGPLAPDELRTATGKAARSLGEDGKKKGLTTTLPLALGHLQTLGQIRRLPTNGRLDQQRYQYALWEPNPLANERRSREECLTELARLFFDWSAPASLGEFQEFASLGSKAARAAIEPLGLLPFDEDNERLIGAAALDAYRAYRVPKKAMISLVGSLDSLFQHRRNLLSHLSPADASHPLFVSEKKAGGTLNDLPSHAIVDRGRIIGLWEYDVDSATIAWCSFIAKSKALSDAVRRTEIFVKEQLGDARAMSLDSPKSRVGRITAVRKFA